MKIIGAFHILAVLVAVGFAAALVGAFSAEAAQGQATDNPVGPTRSCSTFPAPLPSPPTPWIAPAYPGPVSQWLPSSGAFQSPAAQPGASYRASASDSTSSSCY